MNENTAFGPLGGDIFLGAFPQVTEPCALYDFFANRVRLENIGGPGGIVVGGARPTRTNGLSCADISGISIPYSFSLISTPITPGDPFPGTTLYYIELDDEGFIYSYTLAYDDEYHYIFSVSDQDLDASHTYITTVNTFPPIPGFGHFIHCDYSADLPHRVSNNKSDVMAIYVNGRKQAYTVTDERPVSRNSDSFFASCRPSTTYQVNTWSSSPCIMSRVISLCRLAKIYGLFANEGWQYYVEAALGGIIPNPGFLKNPAPVASPTFLIPPFQPTLCPANFVVNLFGSNFTGTTAVLFNGVAAASFTVVNDNLITAVSSGAATTGKITITNAGGSTLSPTKIIINPAYTGQLTQFVQ